MGGLGDWIVAYLNKLRPELRADSSDRRLQDAARLAQHNDWPPDQAAQRVNAGSYSTARQPVVIAILELERIAETKPPTDGDTIAATGCSGCVHGWIDPDDHGPTTPCPTCRPQLAARLAQLPAPGQRTAEQSAYLRHKRTMR